MFIFFIQHFGLVLYILIFPFAGWPGKPKRSGGLPERVGWGACTGAGFALRPSSGWERAGCHVKKILAPLFPSSGFPLSQQVGLLYSFPPTFTYKPPSKSSVLF